MVDHILGGQNDFLHEVISEQGPNGVREQSLRISGETISETEGTARTKALRRGVCRCCLGKIARRYLPLEWRG